MTTEGSSPMSQVRAEGPIELQIVIKPAQKFRGTYNMYNNFEGAGVWGRSSQQGEEAEPPITGNLMKQTKQVYS